MTVPRDAAAPVCLSAGRIGFNGELFESATGHYLLGNGYRAYSPLLMIFLQPDSWSPFGAGGLNAYAYCAGDPVNATDPTGHLPFNRFFQPGRMSRSPSPLPVLSAEDVAQTLAGFASHPVPGSSASRSPSPLPFLTGEDAVRALGGFASHPVPGSSAGRVSPPPVQAGTAPAVSQSSSALLTAAGGAGPSGGVVASTRYKVDYKRLETEIERMTPLNDAEGIIRLSEERFSRKPVLRQLCWQLQRRLGESTSVYATKALGPKLRRRDLVRLEDGARGAGIIEKAEFYEDLRDGLFPPWRRRTRRRGR